MTESLLDHLAVRQHCPECDPQQVHSKSVKIADRSFKCFRCAASGGLAEGLRLFNIAKSIQQPQQKTGNWFDTAWTIYARAATHAHEYLLDRGYPQEILNLEFGWANKASALQDGGLNWQQVEAIGLGSAQSGRELFDRRVVFPIRNTFGRITHFQARSTDPESKCKWLASKSGSIGGSSAPISNALYNAHKLKHWAEQKQDTILLCEGISDALAIGCMGLPAVATFGIQQLNLDRHLELADFNIIAMYDNDRHALGTSKLSGQPKSWASMLPQLAALQRQLVPGRQVYVLEIPAISGVKDTFDLCKCLEWDKAALLDYGQLKSQTLATKILNTFSIDSPDLIKHLAGVPCTPDQTAIVDKAIVHQGGWLNAIDRAFY